MRNCTALFSGELSKRFAKALDGTIMNLKVTLNFLNHDTIDYKKSSLGLGPHSPLD